MLSLMGFPSEEEVKKAETSETPLVLAPSVNASCNYRCVMCFVGSGKAQPGEIGLEEHKSAIDQVSALGARYMIIAMVGEPFMDPAFYDRENMAFPLIDYANKRGLYVVTFTNGSLVTPEILNKLMKKDVSLIGKLWSFDPSIDDELTGTKKDFAEFRGMTVPKGIKLMIDAGFNRNEKGRTRLGIDIIVTSKNFREIPRIVEFSLENGIKPIIDTMIPTERAGEKYDELRLDDDQNKWLYSQLVKIMGKDFTKDQFVEGCAVKRSGFAYDNHGNVKVCCALDSDVGNIKDTPIIELFGRISDLRKNLPRYEKAARTLNACDTARYVKEKVGLEK